MTWSDYVLIGIAAWQFATIIIDIVVTEDDVPFPAYVGSGPPGFNRRYALYLCLLAPAAVVLGPRRAKHWLITVLWGKTPTR